MVSTLVLIYFSKAQLEHTMKTAFKPFQTVNPEMCSILNFYIFNSFIFKMIFQKKYFSCYVLLTDQISLSCFFYLRDIGQYVYCNFLLSSCDVINFEINNRFLNKPLFCITKKSERKCKYL